LKAIFVIQNASQAEMFRRIAKELSNWESLVINLQRWQDRANIEQALDKMNFSYKTLNNFSEQNVIKTVKQFQPGIVVVGNDDSPDSRIFIESANRMNIPTLLVQDGILSRATSKNREVKANKIAIYLALIPFKFFRFILTGRYPFRQKIEIVSHEFRYGPKWRKDHTGMFPGTGNSRKMAVFGETTKELFLSEGVEPERIIITGNPKFDGVYNSTLVNCKANVCKKFGIPEDKKIILLVTQYFVEAAYWSVEQRKKFVTLIADAAASLPDTSLIIKIHHPLEKENEYQEIAKGINSRPVVSCYDDTSELLSACDLVITVNSTAALEGMAIKKPVVIVNLYNNNVSFFNGSSAIFVTKEQEVLPAMQKALYDQKTREEMIKKSDEFVYKRAYLQDGKASERIAKLMISMTNKN
jgi:hypothetical protein